MKTLVMPDNEITAYEFDDLAPDIQDDIICSEIDFYLECIPYEDMPPTMQAACDKAEKMQTPWFTGSYIFDDCRDLLVEGINLNNYLFDENGKMLPVKYYTKGDQVERVVWQITSTTEIPVTIAS
jgi:hypothetical protein